MLILSSLVISSVSILHGAGLLKNLEWQVYDWQMSVSRADTQADEDIAVVLIDDASLKAMDPIVGRWPWPRSVYADLLEFFSLGQPKAVLFDITFSEKQRTQNNQDISEHDLSLVDASLSYPFAYHAARLLLDQADESNQSLLNRPLPDEFITRFSINQRLFNTDQQLSGFAALENNNYYLPFTELWQSASGMGIVDVNSEVDGIYRRARLIHRYQGMHYPALSTTAILDSLAPQNITKRDNSFVLDEVSIPIDDDEKYRVNFYQNYNSYSFSGLMASLQQIRQGEFENLLVSPYEFENKLIFIGASAAGLEDLKRTPIDSRLPGVLIHAAIASNLLKKDFLKPLEQVYSYLFIIVFSLLTIVTIFAISNAIGQTLIPLSIAAGISYLSLLLFKHNIVLELVPILFAVALSWFTSFSSLLLTEGKEKRRFKRMMSQYLSPAVLTTVVEKHEEFAKAEIGSKEEITILFSDIRGFTNMSEKLPPEQVVDILNHYFSQMTDAIFEYQGTIDKFIGDAIMAFWGAPIKTDNHAEMTTLAAMEMQSRLLQVNQWLEENGYQPLAIGIGIHTGQAILGNIGSENKLDYTIIGDNVNLASRMEGLTKQYGCCILITESTYQQLPTTIPCRLLDLVRVKGKQKPIRIYQPLWQPGQMPEDKRHQALSIADTAQQAFAAYLQQDWQQAIDMIEKLPNDQASQTLAERCRHYQNEPPEADWDGVFTMTSK